MLTCGENSLGVRHPSQPRQAAVGVAPQAAPSPVVFVYPQHIIKLRLTLAPVRTASQVGWQYTHGLRLQCIDLDTLNALVPVAKSSHRCIDLHLGIGLRGAVQNILCKFGETNLLVAVDVDLREDRHEDVP